MPTLTPKILSLTKITKNNSKHRPNLNAIYLNNNTATVTDSFRLIEFKLDVPVEKPLLIPSSAFDAIKKQKYNDILDLNDTTLSHDSQSVPFIPLDADEYPETNQVWPQGEAKTIILDVDLLIGLLTTIQKISTKNARVTLSFFEENKPLKIEAGSDIRSLIMPIRQ